MPKTIRERTIQTNLLEFTYYISWDSIYYDDPQTKKDVVYTDPQKGFDEMNHQILYTEVLKFLFSAIRALVGALAKGEAGSI